MIASSLIAAAVPLFADNGRQHVAVATPTVTIRGVVRDSNGAAVAGAYVRSGTYSSSPGGRLILLTVEDFAFEPVTMSMTPTADTTVDFTLATSRPSVTVKLTNGEEHVLDLGTSRFAYYIVFANYARFNSANLCKTDGSAFAPHKTEFAKIVGPFSLVNFSPCCSRGPVMTANVEMKSGEKMQVYFNESCYGSELDFLGRERSTGVYHYFKFDDIAEIEFQ